MGDNWLRGMSEALEKSGKRREEERLKVHQALEEVGPVLWLPDAEDPRFGIGWFRGDAGFFAHQRYVNGWSQHRCAQLEDSLLLKLTTHIPRGQPT